ncbi:MAG: inorganic phosphate transporter [Euryarchaeota archaeon]|nr:inorganic phosphate transporter [Euryarchaeota archaeon]
MLTLVVLIIGLIAALYMAWNIGANDVANSMGTSVGSGALSLKQAIIVAGVFEFLGAVLVGKHVTSTISKGIVSPTAIDPNTLMVGMVAALIGAALWVTLATYFSLPVSTTQSVVGAVMGFAMVINISLIHWAVVGDIVASWIISPLSGAFVAFLIFLTLKKTVFTKDDPLKEAKTVAPFFIFLTVLIIVMSVIYKGLKHLDFDLGLYQSLMISTIIAIIGGVVGFVLLRRYHAKYEGDENKYQRLEKFFMYLQIMTAASVAFAHGANDVANAVGPLVTIVDIYNGTEIGTHVVIPIWVLVLGGAGIVLGLSTWGYRVIYTIGSKITEVTPTRGFSAELATAFVVLVFSKLGMPISTSHVIVGSVLGVGFARGLASVDYKVIKNIIYSWLLTLPVAMAFAAGIFIILRYIFL